MHRLHTPSLPPVTRALPLAILALALLGRCAPSASPPSATPAAAPAGGGARGTGPGDAGSGCTGATGAARQACCAPAALERLSFGDRLRRYHGSCGPLLVAASDQGLRLLTPQLAVVAHPVKAKASHPRVTGHHLYYFAHAVRQLRRLDLRTGRDQAVATLPALTEPCFGQPNPLDFIQEGADFTVDPRAGVACLNVMDRNANMASMGFNYRVDLGSGRVEARMTLAGSECPAKGHRLQKPACQPTVTPGGAREVVVPHPQLPKGLSGWRSASGRWVLSRDAALGSQGDYLYSAVLLYDTRRRLTYAVGPRALVPVDLGRLRAKQARLPAGACLLPGEALSRWMPTGDGLLLEGCAGGAGFRLIELGGAAPVFRSVKASHLTVY